MVSGKGHDTKLIEQRIHVSGTHISHHAVAYYIVLDIKEGKTGRETRKVTAHCKITLGSVNAGLVAVPPLTVFAAYLPPQCRS